MRFHCRMLRILWTARVTNEVLRMGTERCIMVGIRRQLRFLGHVLLAKESEKNCLLGKNRGIKSLRETAKKVLGQFADSNRDYRRLFFLLEDVPTTSLF